MLWVDKHRPHSLEDMDFHKDQAAQLMQMAEAGDLPHMIFYGPSGAGKKTRIMALLRAIYGSGVERVKLENRAFKTPTGKAVELTTVSSNNHTEINPSDAGIYDRFVVQEVIKEMAATVPLDGARSFKVVVLSEVDRLTKDAQASLRRTMEKYSGTCRLILVCNSPSKVIEPLRSRCIGFRVSAPSQLEIMNILQGVAKAEGISLPSPLSAKLAVVSRRNLRQAILMLEATKMQQYPFEANQQVAQMDYERYLSSLADDIIREQSPAGLLNCRTKLYELLVNCIPPEVIIKRIFFYLIEKLGRLSEKMKHELLSWTAYYEHRLQLGNKEIFHLEAYCARLMSILKLSRTQ